MLYVLYQKFYNCDSLEFIYYLLYENTICNIILQGFCVSVQLMHKFQLLQKSSKNTFYLE